MSFGLGEAVRLTHRGRLFLAVALTIGAAGILYPEARLSSLLLSSSLGLVAYALLAAYVVSTKASAAAGLRVEREIPGVLVEDEPFETVLRIRNDSLVVLDAAVVEDTPPPLFKAREKPLAVTTVPARGSVEIRYTVTPVIGRHSWGPVRVRVSDPLGLFEAVVPAGYSTEAYVQPRVPPIPRKRVLATTMYQPGGAPATRRRGAGVEFLELREYQPGDDIRLLEWKAYARTGRLAVKVFEEEGLVRLLLALDASPTMFRGKPGHTSFEEGARLLAGLAAYLGIRGDAVRTVLIPPRGRRLYYTAWARGRRVLTYARRLVAERVLWPGSYYPRQLGESLDTYFELIKLAPRGQAVILLITDLGLSTEVANAFAEKVARFSKYWGASVLVAIPRPLLSRDPWWDAEALEILRAERRVAEALSSRNIPVLHGSAEEVLRVVASMSEYVRLTGVWRPVRR
jgi:uncharacterized protein (DUF58 family)